MSIRSYAIRCSPKNRFARRQSGRPGNGLELQGAGVHDVPRSLCLVDGHPHGRDLRRRERDPRETAPVDGASRVADRVVDGESALSRGHVHELRRVGHVARRPDARVRRPHVCVDLDRFASRELDTRRLQAEVPGVRPPPGRHEDAIGGHLPLDPVPLVDDDAVLPTALNARDGDTGLHLRPLVAEDLGQDPRHLGLLERGDPRQGLEERDPAAEVPEQLPHLQADRVGADDRDRPREVGQLERARGREVPGLLEFGDRRSGRRSARRDDGPIGTDRPPVALEGVGTGGAAAAVVHGEPVRRRDALVLLAPHPIHELILRVDRRSEIERTV